ncbi:YopX family protein [Clostridium massiliamazoniense]|uniref:YopX family protein n=1 Tax=Clostridium massiliamazoniense TaxID=1347366 RepID=UPI0006D79FA8|nr:YopX family protein [Clostridium massiliamazoniense]
MSLEIKCYVVELDSFINDEFMITNKGELLIINKKGLDIKIDKYKGEYYLVQYTELKDSLGVKIYTSDIVETKYEIEGREYSFIGEITHKKGCYFIENDSNTVALWDALYHGTVINIGSKYDNKSKFKKLELINSKVLNAIDQREKKINDAVKKERIKSIRKMINEGIGKQFIINMYSEEEFRMAMDLENKI